ncbi:TasA family protein [Oceanirhabdus seepicola]|uniref:SipW-dependent-type signal peptide-containing protein n=1 Tax=Oceanirhabdus seepicola TaxID=2828781 RepID=A0A9J6NZJ1_9CLOT|nr:TasA family protein [Oceanirhabdus seepicola]MCM1989874.1 SipW-dependent-type signal peptide-containing protein [Oceanirhabdus seepicola]
MNTKEKKYKKRSLALILAIALAIGGGIGAGTYAFFTSISKGNQNNINAGKLETTFEDETIDIGSGGNHVSLTNLAPGNSINYNFKVTNGTSTMDQKYKIKLVNNNVDESGNIVSNDLISAAIYNITKSNGTTIETRVDLTYDELKAYLLKVRTLSYSSKKDQDQYSIIMSLPTTLGNVYQEAKGDFQLEVESTQTEDTVF